MVEPVTKRVVELVPKLVVKLVLELEVEPEVGPVVELEDELEVKLVVELMVEPVLDPKDAVVAAVPAVGVKLVLKMARVDLAVSTMVDVPATVLVSWVTTVEVSSRQPTLPLRSVGIASGWFLPPVTLTTLHASVRPPLQPLSGQLIL